MIILRTIIIVTTEIRNNSNPIIAIAAIDNNKIVPDVGMVVNANNMANVTIVEDLEVLEANL